MFEPNEDFDGTVYIPFKIQAENSRYYYGELEIEVTAAGISSVTGDVTYDVDINDTVTMNWRDFDVYTQAEVRDSVNRVWFTSLPSSSKGVFYYDYGGKNEIELNDSTIYTHIVNINIVQPLI